MLRSDLVFNQCIATMEEVVGNAGTFQLRRFPGGSSKFAEYPL
jgi:hypothetical protein